MEFLATDESAQGAPDKHRWAKGQISIAELKSERSRAGLLLLLLVFEEP
jgi:hypothetical protein